MTNHQYWVVGATWDSGRDGNAYDDFIRYSCWYSGWGYDQQPTQYEQIEQLCVGDRLAIKKMMGQGSKEIMILAIGIVNEIEKINMNGKDIKRFHVKWVLTDLKRLVPAKGAFKTIQGPYAPDDEWTRQVFQL